jgi:hypothetical protein
MSWFKANFLLLNINKVYYLEFRTNNCIDNTLDISDYNKSVANITYSKILGLVIFKMQKRVIRILMGIGYRESCRGLFKDLKILPFASQYILSLLLFVVRNKGYFAPNSVYHNFNTRQRMICICFMYPWLYIRVESFTLVLKFLMLFPHQLKTFPATPKSLKLLSSTTHLLTHFIT